MSNEEEPQRGAERGLGESVRRIRHAQKSMGQGTRSKLGRGICNCRKEDEGDNGWENEARGLAVDCMSSNARRTSSSRGGRG